MACSLASGDGIAWSCSRSQWYWHSLVLLASGTGIAWSYSRSNDPASLTACKSGSKALGYSDNPPTPTPRTHHPQKEHSADFRSRFPCQVLIETVAVTCWKAYISFHTRIHASALLTHPNVAPRLIVVGESKSNWLNYAQQCYKGFQCSTPRHPDKCKVGIYYYVILHLTVCSLPAYTSVRNILTEPFLPVIRPDITIMADRLPSFLFWPAVRL